MICRHCGMECSPHAVFCPKCGDAIPKETQQNAQQTAQQYQQTAQQYQQPQYQPYQQPYRPYQQSAYRQPARSYGQEGQGLAVASLVMGILSFFLIPLVTGILALCFGGVAKSKGNTSGMATGGIVCGAIGLILWLLMLLFWEDLLLGLFF